MSVWDCPVCGNDPEDCYGGDDCPGAPDDDEARGSEDEG